jgi:hypothetical protein
MFYTETVVIGNQKPHHRIFTALKAFGRGTWNFMESMGKARAAAELARLGYHEEAKRLMLENK